MFRVQVLRFEHCFCICFNTQSSQTYYLTKQWEDSDLLSSLLKSFFLILNCKDPNDCVFGGFLLFYLISFGEIFQIFRVVYIKPGRIQILDEKK